MAVPALRIPLSLSMEEFERQTDRAQQRVGTALRVIGRQFADANTQMLNIGQQTAAGVALGWSQSATKTALAFAGKVTAVIAAYRLLSAAIDQTREQIEHMVEIADKANSFNVTPAFLQQFRAEAQKLKVDVEDLDGALAYAFQATKERSPIDINKWETAGERITDVEKALRVYNQEIARAQGKQLDGLVLFRDAADQQTKVIAVLQAMKQLTEMGHEIEALDLGERMFGSKFVDNIRTGKTSAEGILRSMQETGVASRGLFSDEMVKRAKDIDDQLKAAQQRLDRELKPSWDSLANTMLTIKGLWADIVDLMASAVRFVNQIDLSIAKDELAAVKDAIRNGTGLYGLPQVPASVSESLGMKPAQERLREREAELEKRIDELEGRSRLRITVNPETRGAGADLTRTGTTSRDRFDSLVASVEKRTAGVNAEVESINELTQAREKARIAAELEAVAKQVNRDAGLGENVVTKEQAETIERVAEAYGNAAQAIENARSPLATFARESQNVGKALNQFAASSLDNITNELAAVVTGTKSAADAFRSMAQSILNDLARIAIRKAITGPIAAFLGMADGGEIPGFAPGGFIQGPGGPRSDSILARVSAGEFIVNAAAAARNRGLLEAINDGRVPGFANGGMVGIDIPRPVPAGSRGGTVIQVSSTNHFQSGMTPTDIAAINAAVDQKDAAMEERIFARLPQVVRNDPNYLR